MPAPLARHLSRSARWLAACTFAFTVLLAPAARAGVVTPYQLNDFTVQVKLSQGGFSHNPATGLSAGKLKIKSRGLQRSAAIEGTLVLVLHDLPAGVTQANTDGTIDGAPYTLIPGGLAPGATITVPLVFANPARARIAFTPAVHQLVSGAVNARAVRALSQPFTIAAVPDTQVYAEEGLPEFGEQVKWLLANAADRNIVFAAHLGDVVDNGTDEAQWANATAALDPLLAQSELPFSVVRGNHDEPSFFLANLPPAAMAAKPWFVDAAPSGLSQAQVFRVEAACFLHIGFQKDPAADELAWANALLARPELQGLPVIVSTHDYLDGNGRSLTGRMMWEGFVRDNPMVFMVLNGHTHTEYALVSHDVANRPVYQMLSDYQDRPFGGNGLMRLVTVDPAQGRILVKTFSPYFQTKDLPVDTEHHETDHDSEFDYAVNLHERFAVDTTFDFGAEPPPPPLPPLNEMPATVGYSHIFQNRRPLVGTDTPYAGTVDVQVNENNATLNYGGEATLTTDMDDNGSRVHAFLRFEDIVGDGPGQIPPGSTIASARLVFNATSSTKGMVRMHRMLVRWGERSTWMDFTPVGAGGQPAWMPLDYFNYDTGIYRWITLPGVMVGGGVQADGVEAMVETDAVFTMPKPIPVPFIVQPGGYGTTYRPPAASGDPALALTVDLTRSVQAWADGQANHGWFLEPTSSDGWDFETAEGKQPPALLVEVVGAPLVQ